MGVNGNLSIYRYTLESLKHKNRSSVFFFIYIINIIIFFLRTGTLLSNELYE